MSARIEGYCRTTLFVLALAVTVLALLACSAQRETSSNPAPPSENTSKHDDLNAEASRSIDEEKVETPFQPIEIDFPAAEPVLGMIDSRQVQSLNGDWKAIIDPMGVGNPNALSPGFFKDAKNITGMELIEYDFDAADSLRVPGDWNSQKEQLFFYRGQVWYRHIFEANIKRGERLHLHFGAVNFDAQVYLNGEPIGAHQGGYVPFSFDISDAVKRGENSLVVRVSNMLDDSTIPTGRTDWWPYGGITRNISLVITPKAFIRNAKLTLEDHVSGVISARLQTEGYRAGTKVEIEIAELGVVETFSVKANGEAAGSFNAKPELWSPENPKLYDVVISAGKDSVTDKVGFRTIATKGKQILLNGRPIKLKGISMHEEPIGEDGPAFSEAHATRLLEEAKALNVNFVRAAHYPYSRHMAKMADELGLLLWEEIPVYWAVDWNNPETFDIAQDQLTRLIERDWNRASVIIWSVANETPYSQSRMDFLRKLIDESRRLDDSRLVSAALLGGDRESFEQIVTHLAVRGLEKGGLSVKENLIMRAIVARNKGKTPSARDGYTVVVDDPLAELVDIVAYNEYFGWYYSKIFAQQTRVGEHVWRPLMLDLMRDMKITAVVDKPIHISEFGAGAKAGNTDGEALIWTEEYQADVYRAQLAMLKNSPQVQGMTPWVLKDFRAMLRPRAGVQDFYNRKGLIDETGQKKQAYHVLSNFYANEWHSKADE